MHGKARERRSADLNAMRGREKLVSIAARLAQLKVALQARGLGIPESPKVPGTPNIEAVARLISADPSCFRCVNGEPRLARKRLWSLADEIGLIQGTGLASAIVENPIKISAYAPDETMIAILQGAEQLRKLRLGIPQRPYAPGKPHLPLLAALFRTEVSSLSNPKQPYLNLIHDLSVELGFVCREEFSQVLGIQEKPKRRKAMKESRACKLETYLSRVHLLPGLPLPESSRAPGRPAYRKLCLCAGVSWKSGCEEPAVVSIIDEAAQAVGLGKDGYRPPKTLIFETYGEVLETGLRKFALESSGSSKGNLVRLKWAFRKWLMAVGKDICARVDGDVARLLDETVPEVSRQISNTDTRRHWATAMRSWRSYVKSAAGPETESLPSSFAGALQALLRAGSVTDLRAALRRVGLDPYYSRIRAWLRGHEPRLTEPAVIGRLEDLLNVDRGTLESRIRQSFGPSVYRVDEQVWPSALDKKKHRGLARALLPADFVRRSPAEREAIGIGIRREIEGEISYRRRLRNKKHWWLKPVPDQLRSEWEGLVSYKTDPAPRLPRSTTWRPASVGRNEKILLQLFSAMAMPASSGGLGIQPEGLSLGFLASTGVLNWYLKWLADRYPEGLPAGVKTDLSLISLLTAAETRTRAGLPTGVKGYLHYNPGLAQRLVPIPSVLGEDEISLLCTPEGWRDGLSLVHLHTRSTLNNKRFGLRKERDPFAPILPILEMDRPLDALIYMLECMYRDLPEPATSSAEKRAIAVRRFVASLILVRTLLRAKNVVELTWLRSNRGELRRRGDRWVVVIAPDQFKNCGGSFFGTSSEPFEYTLFEEDTAIIDEYVHVSRPALLSNSSSNALFVGKQGPISQGLLYAEMANATWRHLVYHEATGTGMPGVERFGPHAIRDIGATHILKQTADTRLAADAIQDSEETVIRHYARYLPKDRTRRVTEFLTRDLGSVVWGRMR